jgi:hypothetical protein
MVKVDKYFGIVAFGTGGGGICFEGGHSIRFKFKVIKPAKPGMMIF